MPPHPLTDEQIRAVSAASTRLFIEAPPGAGKTTVAAERFGVLRYSSANDPATATSAVSFTRSATGELRHRIRDRWGSTGLSWLHEVKTIDAMIRDIVEMLLRRATIRWPGGHVSIEVIDSWRGQRGCRWLDVGGYMRRATVDASGSVVSTGARVTVPAFAIGNRAYFDGHLAQGRCTHDEIRSILSTVLGSGLRTVIADFLSTSIAHLIVDEVFDANKLDLELVGLACDVGVPVTLLGDPWQALYGFRGARPDLVPAWLVDHAFETESLTHSFRFLSPEMQHLNRAARSGDPVVVDRGGEVDVVLASRWDQLWGAADQVLPLSFGWIKNKTDAAGIVLLDHLVHPRFGQHASFLPEALLLLDLDEAAYRSHGQDVLRGVVDILREGQPGAPGRALDALRQAVRELGATRRPPSGNAENEARQLERMEVMAKRLRYPGPLRPGLTIHQAKGREWDRVGLSLTAGEIARLSAGLHQEDEADRALYVALTRARSRLRVLD